MKGDTTEYTVTEYTSERGNHIVVRRPLLSDEERAKRMAQIKDAAVRLVIETEKQKIQRRKTA